MRRRRQVGIAHAEVDDVGAAIAGHRLGAIDLLKDLRRQPADAIKLFHNVSRHVVSGEALSLHYVQTIITWFHVIWFRRRHPAHSQNWGAGARRHSPPPRRPAASSPRRQSLNSLMPAPTSPFL